MALDGKLGAGENRATDTLTINGSTTSEAQELGSAAIAAILIPSGFSGSTVTIQGSIDNSTFKNITSLKALAVTADEWLTLDPAKTYGFPYIKVVSAASETSKTLTLAYAKFA